MRTATATVLLLLLTAAAAPAADASAAPGRIVIAGLSETRFHPLAGSFEVRVADASLSQDAAAIRVFINDQPLDAANVHPSDASIRVDYRFRPGLNEVLVEATGREGRRLRADALVYAGGNGLSVNVGDARRRPVDKATVRVTLVELSSVRFDGRTSAGSLFVQNLPPGKVVVEARDTISGASSRAIVDTADGYVSLTLSD